MLIKGLCVWPEQLPLHPRVHTHTHMEAVKPSWRLGRELPIYASRLADPLLNVSVEHEAHDPLDGDSLRRAKVWKGENKWRRGGRCGGDD